MKKSLFAILFIVFTLQACATTTAANHALYDADSLFRAQKYDDAIAAYRKLLKNYPGSHVSADAQFAIAYILIDPDNPDMDYSQAMSEFGEFIRSYPDDPRVQEARNWYMILKTLNDTRKENARLNNSIRQLQQLDIRREKMSR